MTALAFPLHVDLPADAPVKRTLTERDLRLQHVCRKISRVTARIRCTRCGARFEAREGRWYPATVEDRVRDWQVRCDCGRPLPWPVP